MQVTVIRPGAVRTNLDAFQNSESVVDEVDPESKAVQMEVSFGLKK